MEEIATALRDFLGMHHQLIEGAAVPLAALLRERRRAAVNLSEANIGLEVPKEVFLGNADRRLG